MLADLKFPDDPSELTPELLTAAMASERPGLVVRDVRIVEAIQAASGRASTADRVVLDLDYAPGPVADGLPRRVVLKTMLVAPHAPAVMYETECRFYSEVRPTVPFEAPECFAACFDRESGHFGLILEDLNARDVVFPNVTMEVSLGQVRALIGHLAALHAKYWQSPALARELAWMAAPAGGGMEETFKQLVPLIQSHLDADPWRQEICAPIGRSVPELHADMLRIAANALELAPRTLLHGDTHLGNSYRLGSGEMGWLDFQLSHRGCYSRDLTYIITTALPIELRREHERELIRFYLDEIRRLGVEKPPSWDEAWLLHRQSTFWGLVIGWLTCPTANYGREITEENIRRLAQVMIDLEVLETVDA